MSPPYAFAAALLLVMVSNRSGLGLDKVSDGQWFHQTLRTEEANAVIDGRGVVVGLIDSGVDYGHPDLAGSVLPGTDLVASGDGRIDTDGHGTAMAGLICAHGRVDGLAPGAKILPVRTSTSFEPSADRVAQGIRWAANHGAKVLSVAWSANINDLVLHQEIMSAIASDIVVVASVGNHPADQAVGYPASIPGVLAVAGVDKSGNRSRISVAGPEVDIAAPSDNISSTDKGGGYREGTGTSDAAAIVAGAVALVRAKYPELKGPEVVRRLTATATDKGAPGRDDEYGYGVLNIVAALTAVLPAETPSAGGTATGGVTPGVGASAPGKAGGGGAAWWLLAVLPATAVVIVGVTWLRRRRIR